MRCPMSGTDGGLVLGWIGLSRAEEGWRSGEEGK